MSMIAMGNSNFKEIREEGYYYVDKSLLIRELLQDGSKVVLIPRPRRFGKTLNLNMCEAFFSDQEPNRQLFEGLAIASDLEAMEHHGAYPTIAMTFKDLHADSWESCQLKLKNLVSKLFQKFEDRIQPSQHQQRLVNDLIRREAPIELVEESLQLLTQLLFEKTGKMVYLFIDEYDAPIQDGFFSDYYEKIVSFSRAFFGSVLKDNRYLRKGVLTGVLRIAQESLFSGLNNIQVSTVLDQGYSNHFGFTEAEVRQILQDFQLTYREAEIREWYNGYRIGALTLYNPWSILSVAAKTPKAPESYWINTAQDKLIENLITRERCMSLGDLTSLLKGDSLTKEITPALSLNRIDAQSIWSLLLFSGYLTFGERKSETRYDLKLPNREVRIYFEQIVRRWIEGTSSPGEPLKDILVQGNLSAFHTYLKDRILRMVGLNDTGGRSDPENFYHGLVLGLFAYGLDEIYEIKSNRESGLGRYDLQLSPRKPGSPSYIFEFKSLKKGGDQDLITAAEAALSQIREKQYAVELKHRGVHPIWFVGIAFHGKRLEMTWTESEGGLEENQITLPTDLSPGSRKATDAFHPSQNGAAKQTQPKWFHVPHRQNPDFVGRASDLAQLANDLANAQISAITPLAAATGLGGIGKTQLAIEFAYRNARNYPGGVFWLNCAQAPRMADEIINCGLAMDLFEEDDPRPLKQKVRAVTKAWDEDARPRLLIFDNCEDEQILVQWAPKSQHHHILVTSRRQDWTVPGLKANALATLSRAESVTLLQTQRPDLSTNDAEAIAAELADLPLALFLAARYLHSYRHQISPAAYLSELQSAKIEHPSLQGKGAGGYQPTQHDIHVGHSFAVSIDRLDPKKKVDVLARQLLLHASYFAPGESIQPKHLLATLADAAASETPSEALQRLTELGLLRPEEGDQLSLHRLLGYYTQTSQSNEARMSAEAKVIETLLEFAIAANNSGLPAQMSPILAHLRHQAEKHLNEASPACHSLCANMGFYLNSIASFDEAEHFYRRGLACAEQVYGPDHEKTALILNNLAQLLQATNRLAEAEPLMCRALAIDEASFGSDHPNVARDLNNLTALLQATNRLAEAEPLMRRALAIDEASFGSDHPNVARDLNNLAQLLQATNRLAEAEPLIRRALAIDEASFGSDHPNVARDLHNLACLLVATERRDQALPMSRRAHAIFTASLGAVHPYTLTVQRCLDKHS